MIDCNFVNIPMKARCFIDMQKKEDYKKAKIKPYWQLIDKLMYLSYSTRPNISFTIKQLSKHNADLQTSHIKSIIKDVHYLKNRIHLGLIYGRHLKDE